MKKIKDFDKDQLKLFIPVNEHTATSLSIEDVKKIYEISEKTRIPVRRLGAMAIKYFLQEVEKTGNISVDFGIRKDKE